MSDDGAWKRGKIKVGGEVKAMISLKSRMISRRMRG